MDVLYCPALQSLGVGRGSPGGVTDVNECAVFTVQHATNAKGLVVEQVEVFPLGEHLLTLAAAEIAPDDHPALGELVANARQGRLGGFAEDVARLEFAETERLKSERYSVTPSTCGSFTATTSTESLKTMPLALNSEMVVASALVRRTRDEDEE